MPLNLDLRNLDLYNNDQSDWPATLPRPELNPLINPILGKNLGRWAEVYFTTAPERREEAVLRLLRELQGEASSSSAEVAVLPSSPELAPEPGPVSIAGPDVAAESVIAIEPVKELPLAEVRETACPFCGRKNPEAHRFCGMCGKIVDGSGLVSSSLFEDANMPPAPETDSESTDVLSPTLASAATPVADEESRQRPQLAVKNSARYRGYAIVAVVVVCIALAYYATHNARPARAMAPAESGTEAQAAPVAATDPSGQPSSVQRQVEILPAQPASEMQAMTPAADKEPLANDNGGQELAIAKQYLNGTAGMAQDSGKAAEWLWKAVSKHNADAPMLLANLYLKGEGVPKNCDQARLLLDDAAHRAIPGAEAQLRQIRDSGCP